jgi:SnoaL-like domain
MDAVERLAAIEDIKRLKARYFRCLDTKEWSEFTTVFAADAVLDTTADGAGVVVGNREIAEFVQSVVGDVTTVHHGHSPEIEVISPTSATGIWAMEDKLWWPDDSSSVRAMHGYGHYRETYEKVSEEWHIKALTLTRLRVDFVE